MNSSNSNLDPKLLAAIAANVAAARTLSKSAREAALKAALDQIAAQKGERFAAATGFMAHVVYTSCLAELSGRQDHVQAIEHVAAAAIPMLHAFGLNEKELVAAASPIVEMQLETARALLQQAVRDAEEDLR